MTTIDDLEYVTEKSEPYLNHRQALDYNDHREQLIEWLHTRGKDPEQNVGLADDTSENYASRIDRFYRWVWTEFNGYTTQVTREHADEYVRQLQQDELTKDDGDPYLESTKRKHTDAVRKLFVWRHRQLGEEPWDTDVTFSETSYSHPDILSIGERQALREAVLEYDSIPAYGDLSPEERDRWKAYIAQKLGKKKSEVSPDDWERINHSWKFPSLIWTALDAGLRPIEIERSTVGWLRLDKGALYIPKDDSSKNRDNWEVALQPRTVKALERWLEERENYSKYDDREALWLNQRGNPYNSATLNHLLDQLLEAADIDQTNRDIKWYSIRHSVGTHMASKGNLAETQEQLRHKNLESTLQYTHPPVEDRQETLDKMG